MRALLLLLLVLLPTVSSARPFRAMVTRTAETTSSAHFELGLRYQGFFAGRGSGLGSSLPYHQLTPSLRVGLLRNVEANLHYDVLLLDNPGSAEFRALPGDLPIGLQWTFVERRLAAIGVYLRATVPTGSGLHDIVPPSLPDGTLDGEATLIAELRVTTSARLMLNLGYLHHGVRRRGSASDFDVPDAFRYDAALTANVGPHVLLGLELVGRYYLRPEITPFWDDNPNQLEVIPHLRIETIPNLVLEAALGVALTSDLQEIYRVRGLLGFTYEFDLAPGEERRKSRGRGRRR